MADLIKNIQISGKTYQIKDVEAADTRITEEEITMLLTTNYVVDHTDHTKDGGSN
jgi:hypothetical protein